MGRHRLEPVKLTKLTVCNALDWPNKHVFSVTCARKPKLAPVKKVQSTAQSGFHTGFDKSGAWRKAALCMTGAEARTALSERLAELDRLDALGEDGRAPVTLQQDSVSRLRRMDAMQQQAMAQAEAQWRQAERARIRAALARLDEGEWGYCVACGEEIAAGHLAGDPSLARCVRCAA